MTDQINTEDPEVKGHKPIIKNTAKKTKPKLLFELIFTLDLSEGDTLLLMFDGTQWRKIAHGDN